jgi:hypothetical protein
MGTLGPLTRPGGWGPEPGCQTWCRLMPVSRCDLGKRSIPEMYLLATVLSSKAASAYFPPQPLARQLFEFVGLGDQI